MTRYDIFAVAGDHQWTIARGRDGNPDMLRAASQTEADEWRRGARVEVVPSGAMPGEPQPSGRIEL